MSNTPPGDIVSSHPKATLLTTFTAILVAIVQQIKDEDYKKIAVPLAPFVVLVFSIISKTFYKRYKCNGLIKVHKSWIITLENELKVPTTAPARKKEILKEIVEYQNEIKKPQKEAIEIEFN
jgi:hypothetical protein